MLPLLLLALPAQAADTWTAVAPGIDRLYRTASGPLQIHVAQIDLSRDEISLRATGSSEAGRTTSSFASAVGATVAINGDWFTSGATPAGLAMGDGWSWGSADTTSHSFIACNVTNECWIDPSGQASSLTPRHWNVVGGNNARLVVDGVAQAHAGAFYTTDRHPRSAVGLSADGQTLWMVVIDGRTASSVGITWNDTATLLHGLGAHQALMLDGGGSSTLVVDGVVVNRPSDGSPRSVANHLGVRWSSSVDAGCSGIPNGKYCEDATQLATCTGGTYRSGDCGAFGLTCEEDADFAYCVDSRCAAGGQGSFCVDDTVVAGCTDGVYGDGDCAYYGLHCVEGFGAGWCANTFFQGEYAGTTLPVVDGVIEVPPGESRSGLVSFVNTGLSTWTPATTTLAPLPRDEAHALATDAWAAGHRVSSVLVETAPGETGTFPVSVSAPADGNAALSLALVEEGVTWFADQPAGGGPAEGDLVFSVARAGSSGGSGSGGTGGAGGDGGGSGGGGSSGGSGTDAGAPTPDAPASGDGAAESGCAVGGLTALGAWSLGLVIAATRRERHLSP